MERGLSSLALIGLTGEGFAGAAAIVRTVCAVSFREGPLFTRRGIAIAARWTLAVTGASLAAFLIGSKGAALLARTRCFTIRRGGGGLRCGALKLLFTIRARGVALLALWPPDFNHFRRGLGGGGVRDCFSGRRKFGCGLFNG